MALSRSARSKVVTASLLLLAVLAGLSGPTYIFLTSRATPLQIQLPGTPINETAFAVLESEVSDSVVFTGSYVLESFRPYVLNFIPQTSNVISEDKALNISRDFIPAHYWDYLNYIHWTEFNPNLPEWTFRFTSHRDDTGGYDGLVVVTGVNAITGRITWYHVHWDSKVDSEILPEPIESDGSPVNRSIVEEKLVQFLADNEYTLPRNTRLLEVETWPNETMGEWYRFKMGTPTGPVLPDEAIQGLKARVDAITGEIMDFTYRQLEIPQISVDGLINPDYVYAMILKGASAGSSVASSECLGSFLRFRLITSTHDLIRLQLVWAFQFKDEDSWLFEVHRDAYSGDRPIPNPHIIFDASYQGHMDIIAVPILAIALSTIVFLILRKYTRHRIA